MTGARASGGSEPASARAPISAIQRQPRTRSRATGGGAAHALSCRLRFRDPASQAGYTASSECAKRRNTVLYSQPWHHMPLDEVAAVGAARVESAPQHEAVPAAGGTAAAEVRTSRKHAGGARRGSP